MAKGKGPTHRSFGEFIQDFFGRDSDQHSNQRRNRIITSASRSRDLPPSYEDAVASRQHRDGGHQLLSTDDMDPIVASAYWNQTQSPLVRLPDVLIVAIMELVDLDDILRLRHVSRDFMRLFNQSKVFWKYHLTDAHDHNKRTSLARIWATPLDCFPGQHLRLSENTSLCDSCTAFRKDKGYGSDRELLKAVPFIYCAGCNIEHRAFFFSARQRHESNDDERLCRGREGCITLCEHVSITWDSAQRLADAPPGQNTIQCDNGHHKVSPCQHVKDGTSKFCCNDDKPRFKFYRDERQNLCFNLSITTHLPFRPQGSEQGSKVSSRAFRASIKKLVHDRLPVSSFHWVPSNTSNTSSTFGCEDISRCFDPNICSCLDWGQPMLPSKSDAPRTTASNKFEWKLCPNPTRSWRLRANLGSPTFAGRNEFQREHQDRCAGFSHNLHYDDFVGSWDWDFEKCSENEDFLVFTQTVRSCVSSPHENKWSWFINYASYELMRDDEMRGISWCSKSRCRFWLEQCLEVGLRDGDEELLHHRSMERPVHSTLTQRSNA
ncbi:hypothetical protein B0T10DRAFT_453431 [Thelonectria olida]|uniref:F-box domain-containing protein n=1 Tax=Thelonectria olida TaxID=1576542 RepID=A0A9P8WEM0_9HYPO|nr:hypothetical protein B0T10DRAFT_453431 [Thelonectria olida]